MKITFLTEEWTQSTKDSCSTLMRQMAIELFRIENVEIGILIPSASPKDRKDTQKYNIKVFEPEKYPGYESVDCLQFPPQGFSTDFIISHGIKPDVMERSLRITLKDPAEDPDLFASSADSSYISRKQRNSHLLLK